MNNKNPAQKEDPFGDFMKSQGINVVDVTPTQKEEWEQEYITLIGTLMELSAFSAYISSFHHAKTVEFIRSQISLAEARGREATITAFEEEIQKKQTYYCQKGCEYPYSDGHEGSCELIPENQALIDLLSFADSLKSNAPKGMTISSLIEVFRMTEIAPETRAKIIIKLGRAINNSMGMSITEALVLELVALLDPTNAILNDENYKRTAHQQ